MRPSDKLTELDSLVQSAIADLGARPAPFGLNRKIENRVRLLMLIQRERGWFIRTLASRGVLFSLTIGALVWLFISMGNPDNGFGALAPGGAGYLDYLAIVTGLTWSRLLAQPAFLTASIAGIVFLTFGAVQLQHYLRRRFP